MLEEERSITTVYFGIAEDNERLQLRQPWIAIATDARGIDPADPDAMEQHPRACGTYPPCWGGTCARSGCCRSRTRCAR